MSENGTVPAEVEEAANNKVQTAENTEKVEITESDVQPEGPSALEQKIIRQIEYYYGDLNIVKDKFLQEQIKEDNGWVSMETMLKFKRLAALSTDPTVIVTALKKSTSGLMEVSEDGSKLRRSPDKPVPDFNKNRNKDLKNRSVYAKGFPLDVQLDTLINFFDEYGKTDQIFMRRDREKKFKGSVFVTYSEEEGAKMFLEAENVKYQDNVLIRYKKEDYFKMKEEERKKHKENKIREKEQKKEDKQDEEEENVPDEDFKASITTGAILELKNIPEDATREDLKELLDKHSTIAWQDFKKGQSEAKIRFEDEDGAKTAWEKALEEGEGKVELKGSALDGRVLQGDEEIEHWKKIREVQKEMRNRKRSRGGRRGGRSGGSRRGGRVGNRRSQGNIDSDGEGEEGEPPEKVAKTD